MTRRSATWREPARLSRLLCATVSSAALLAGMTALPAHAQPAPTPTAPTTPEQQAKATGKPVELADQGTERTKVFVNPDGTRTLEARPGAVRVRRDDGWEPVDTSLKTRPDGALTPKAVTAPIVFSGGGTAPLVEFGAGERKVSLSWPSALPKPTVDGDSATYAEVFPGVDLVLNARAEGFTQVLVVKNAEAADNPDLREVALKTSTTGVSLKEGDFETPKVVDKAGVEVLSGAKPMMWDSSGADPQRGEASSADGPSIGAKRAALGLDVTGDSLEVTTDEKLLTGEDTVYPVYIDPPFNASRLGGTELWKNFSNDPNWNNWYTGVARVGYEAQTGQTVRSVWTFDIGALQGKIVKTAWFQATQTHAWNCNDSYVNLWRTTEAGPGTNWNNIGWLQWLDSRLDKGGAGCPTVGVDLNAVNGVVGALNEGKQYVSLGISAGDENTVNGWRKFDPNPALNITYNSRPNTPTELSTDGTGCATGANRPYLRNPNPQFTARVSDSDGAENPLLNARFYWGHVNGGDLGSGGIDGIPNGEIARYNFPTGTFTDGGQYAWTVGVGDYIDPSARSTFCEFVLDLSQPAAAPGVSSTDFPADDEFHGIAGTAGQFTFAAGGVSDVAGYRYGYENPPVNYVAASSLGGTASVNLTAKHLGRNVVYVQSVDRAGNVSAGQPAAYAFHTDQQTVSTGRWQLDGDGSDVADVPHPLTASPTGVSWVAGRDGQAAQLNGGVLTTAGPVVATNQSFSVAAWVKLGANADPNGWYNALSQDGNRNSAFVLQYSGSTKGWVFDTPNADADGSGEAWVTSNQPAEKNVWTRLIGVYDAASGEIKLYVNGVYQGSAKRNTPWNAGGSLVVGRGKQTGASTGAFAGAVDDVVVYDRVLVAEDISELSNRPAVMEGHWAFNDPAPTGPASTITLGAKWDVGYGGTGQSLRLAGGTLSTPAPMRTDQSFTVSARVFLRNKGNWFDAVSQDGNRNSGFVLQYSSSSDKWAFDMPDADADGSAETWVNSTATAATETWTHLTGVYDATAGKMRLYVNGVLQGETTKSSSWNAAGSLVVGRGKQNGASLGYFPGTVDDVFVYGSALTAAQITALHQSTPPAGWAWQLDPAGTSAVDSSTRDRTATVFGGAAITGGKLQLADGDDFAATVGSALRTDQSFSVTARVTPSQLDGRRPIVSQSGTRVGGYYLQYSDSRWTFAMGNADQDNPVEDVVKSSNAPTNGQQVNLAAVYDAAAGELRLYVNGVPQGDPTKHVSTWNAAGSVGIGRALFNGSAMTPFLGGVDSVRVYQGVLTPREIKLISTSG
ncbi:hypothetical protein GCM10022243_66140 [Saccharothrix violaceirubra]|uniref:LamG-like jellyroll fold domain-containing protein n=1 Tax=Saccharothrix violaceirubra TaxID=413306 RepID=A0A7W7T977_9PSEU|nr:LamG domain-containing protein [Saccharothrix violaceirubra]MBB4968901.1 hypothetical protein [Saccharothrix violaceirubra]